MTDDKQCLPTRNTADALPDEVSRELHGQGDVVRGGGFVVSERFDGPLPPPSLLKQYEAVLPGLAREIFPTGGKRESIGAGWSAPSFGTRGSAF